LAGVSTAIAAACRRRHRLQSFVMMKTTNSVISNGGLEKFQKKICLLALAILFLFAFFNLILDAPRT
jgi:hypothetical protein